MVSLLRVSMKPIPWASIGTPRRFVRKWRGSHLEPVPVLVISSEKNCPIKLTTKIQQLWMRLQLYATKKNNKSSKCGCRQQWGILRLPFTFQGLFFPNCCWTSHPILLVHHVTGNFWAKALKKTIRGLLRIKDAGLGMKDADSSTFEKMSVSWLGRSERLCILYIYARYIGVNKKTSIDKHIYKLMCIYIYTQIIHTYNLHIYIYV